MHGKQALKTLNFSGKFRFLVVLDNLVVPKKLFVLLYLFGILCAIGIWTLTYNTILNDESHLVMSMWFLHLTRRLFESIVITEYGDSTMHLFGFLVGIAHYALAPITLLSYQHSLAQTLGDEAEFSYYGSLSMNRILVMVLFLTSNYVQFRCHYILFLIKQMSPCYGLPDEFLFRYVSCPHYTAEIFIYTWLTVLNFPRVSYSSIALLLWVTSNLAVVSSNQHSFYELNFPEKLRKNWYKLIPGMY